MVPLGVTQAVVLKLYVVMAAIIVIGFMWVLANVRRSQSFEVIHHPAYRLRAWWFYLLLVVVAFGLYFTLSDLPFVWAAKPSQETAALHVAVVGRQFQFSMPDRLPAGRPIEFDVTGGDVNHGFGIFNPEGDLIAQTQAMPDYTNRLLYTFTQPGTYRVRCLEYCGMGHFMMTNTFVVYSPAAKAAS